MSRSILLPLLALGGIILFGTTRAARPAPDFVPVEQPGDGLVILDEDPPLTRLDPAPPPAPRLRSDEVAPPPAPAPVPVDSVEADTPKPLAEEASAVVTSS